MGVKKKGKRIAHVRRFCITKTDVVLVNLCVKLKISPIPAAYDVHWWLSHNANTSFALQCPKLRCRVLPPFCSQLLQFIDFPPVLTDTLRVLPRNIILKEMICINSVGVRTFYYGYSSVCVGRWYLLKKSTDSFNIDDFIKVIRISRVFSPSCIRALTDDMYWRAIQCSRNFDKIDGLEKTSFEFS